MKRILVVEKSNFYTKNAILENFELVDLIVEENNLPKVGNIYIGKVTKILNNKFAFVDLGYEKNAFLNLEDSQEKNIYSIKNNKKVLNIKQGQNILVKIKKDGTDKKGNLVTTNISITGKYLILNLNNSYISFSNKILDIKIKNSIEEFISKILPENYGVIVRTSAKDVSLNTIERELLSLIKKAENLFKNIENFSSSSKVYSEISETEKIIRDYLSKEDNVYIDDELEYNILKNNTNFKNLHLYKSDLPIFENFYIESQVEKALNKKVWLKSGGFIIIDEVEAMNIIDVNSGKNIYKQHDEMVFKTNLEAVYESFKQIRLRNLSGMVIIDFINMNNKEHIETIYKTSINLADKDKCKITITSMDKLGLLHLTRKKERKSLQEVLNKKCPVCLGKGFVHNENYVANIIKNRILSIISTNNFNYIKISSNKRIIESLRRILNIDELKYNIKIELNTIQTIKFDYFEIEKENKKDL